MTSALLAEDPTRIGDYEVSARLGQGGQGTVYLGRAADGSDVAIKVLGSTVAADQRLRARFAREAAAARKVARFCTAAVLDADITSEPPYIASEYIAGPSLKEAVLAEGPRTGAALERLAIATATALVAIHQAGVIHRDLKPANVILGPDGPRVIDFGIARADDLTMTHGQSLMGTPAYMAPEQVQGKEPTPAMDIFAWACVIAYAATGSSPFQGDTVPSIMHRVLTETPSLEGIEDPLRSILESCLSKEPEGRPNATQLLSRLLGGEDTEATAALPVAQMMETGYSAATRQMPAVAGVGGLVGGREDGTASATGADTAATPVDEQATALVPSQGVAGNDGQATALMEGQAAGDGQATALIDEQATATADPATQLLAAGAPGAAGSGTGTPQAGGGPTGTLPPAPPAPAPPTGQPGTGRGVVPWLVAAAVAVVAIGVVSWLFLSSSEEPNEPRQPTEAVASSPVSEDEPVQEEPEGQVVQQDQPAQDVPAETGGEEEPYDPYGNDQGNEWDQGDDWDGDTGGGDDGGDEPAGGDTQGDQPAQGGEE